MYKKIFSTSIHGAAAGIQRFKSKLGAAPGTVEYTGLRPKTATRIFVTDYDETGVQHLELNATDNMPPQIKAKRWIQVSGLSDTEFIKEFGSRQQIPTLVLEDIVNPGHLAKLENLDDFIFIILKVPLFHEQNLQLHFEHVCILLFENRIISFQESDTFHFEALIKRMNVQGARMRLLGCDYFMYAMIDLVIDTYAFLGDLFAENMDTLEEEVLDSPHQNHVNRIHQLKHRIAATRKAIRPLRGITESLFVGDLPFITEEISPYLNDLRDHVTGLFDAIENHRESSTLLMESYLSLMSHRMNEIMKVLTMMSAIFIPLGFLAGLYGMNFDHMPELHYRYGYYGVLGIMGSLVLTMVVYFKYKKWL
ncbi:MAG: magnesium/cobalt transporter CorA [Deltaproteobacteria bacterium]|nr:magnesium/cobalt transporter CorA [Deltaproteobacteria bacterium]